MVDPLSVKIVASHIADHFAQVDPKSAAQYRANLAAFNAKVDAKLVDWQKQLAPYKGAKIVTYHKDFPYLAERFGLQVVETLEPKPGIAPSPAHLAKVISAGLLEFEAARRSKGGVDPEVPLEAARQA